MATINPAQIAFINSTKVGYLWQSSQITLTSSVVANCATYFLFIPRTTTIFFYNGMQEMGFNNLSKQFTLYATSVNNPRNNFLSKRIGAILNYLDKAGAILKQETIYFQL